MKIGQHAAYCPAVTSTDMNPCECGADHDLIEEAGRLGCSIERVEFNQQPDRYYWNCEWRSSADQYAASFSSAEEAAAHFLESREGKNARRRIVS